MSRYLSCAITAVLLSVATAEPASAQLVQVSPGYVRAPFVRVYRDADGGTHVQAPFVNRYTPGRYDNRWNRDPRDAATRTELRQMPEARVRRQLFGAALDLDQSLGRFETADSWRRYLAVAPGLLLSRDRFEDSEEARSSGQFAELLVRFDAVSKNADYRMISTLPEFQWTHELLAAYTDRGQSPQPTPAEELPPPQPLDPLNN